MKQEFSAGGVVFKKNGREVFVLVAQHSQHHGWVFPKGLIGDHIQNETKEDTAVREVEEETGAVATIIQQLSSATFWYQFANERIKKTVYYYLMQYVSGNIQKHDFEMEQVEWLPIQEVEKRLTYASDKKVWQEAKKIISEIIS